MGILRSWSSWIFVVLLWYGDVLAVYGSAVVVKSHSVFNGLPLDHYLFLFEDTSGERSFSNIRELLKHTKARSANAAGLRPGFTNSPLVGEGGF